MVLITLRPEPWAVQPYGSYNQNALIRKATNEFVSFSIDNGLRQMAIFTSLGGDLFDLLSIKTNKILQICLFII